MHQQKMLAKDRQDNIFYNYQLCFLYAAVPHLYSMEIFMYHAEHTVTNYVILIIGKQRQNMALKIN